MDKFDEYAATAPPRPPMAPGASGFYGTPPLAGVQTTPPFRLADDAAGPAPPVFGAGNINLSNRPAVLNPDGSVSTVRSMSANIDGHEVLMPTVSDDARLMSDDEAIQQYLKTGRNLGTFDTVPEADAYAKQLHERQSTLPVGHTVPAAHKGDRPKRKRRAVP